LLANGTDSNDRPGCSVAKYHLGRVGRGFAWAALVWPEYNGAPAETGAPNACSVVSGGDSVFANQRREERTNRAAPPAPCEQRRSQANSGCPEQTRSHAARQKRRGERRARERPKRASVRRARGRPRAARSVYHAAVPSVKFVLAQPPPGLARARANARMRASARLRPGV
jgi:hypothetical protein